MEINKTENRKTIDKYKKTKRWFFEKINKIDNVLAKMAKIKREKNQITKVVIKRGTSVLKSQKTKILHHISRKVFGKTSNHPGDSAPL